MQRWRNVVRLLWHRDTCHVSRYTDHDYVICIAILRSRYNTRIVGPSIAMHRCIDVSLRPYSPDTWPHPVLHILLPRYLLLFVPLSRHLTPSSPPHPSPKISSAVRPTLQTLDPIQSSTSLSQDFFACSSHSPDTWPHPVLHILLQRFLCLFVPLSRHLPHPVLHILLPRYLLLFVPLSRHLTPSSPPHPSPKISSAVRPTLQTLDPIQSSTSFSQDFFCCSSHSPDTWPHPVLHILLPRYLLLFVPLSRHLPPSSPPHPSPKISSAVRPTLQTLAPIQSSTSISQDIFCCSSHSPDTWPHPVLHILLPRYLLLFVPLTIHLPHPVLHILLPRYLLLFVPLSRHLTPSNPPHPSPKISLPVRPTLQTLDPIQSSTSLSQDFFACSSHSPDTWPHPVLHILLQRFLCLFVPLSRHLPPSSPPHPSPKISSAVRPTLQ